MRSFLPDCSVYARRSLIGLLSKLEYYGGKPIENDTARIENDTARKEVKTHG
jgi:hypothetical protein